MGISQEASALVSLQARDVAKTQHKARVTSRPPDVLVVGTGCAAYCNFLLQVSSLISRRWNRQQPRCDKNAQIVYNSEI